VTVGPPQVAGSLHTAFGVCNLDYSDGWCLSGRVTLFSHDHAGCSDPGRQLRTIPIGPKRRVRGGAFRAPGEFRVCGNVHSWSYLALSFCGVLPPSALANHASTSCVAIGVKSRVAGTSAGRGDLPDRCEWSRGPCLSTLLAPAVAAQLAAWHAIVAQRTA
jgi:hypothetical protein